jgi:L-asparaginase
MAELTLIETGGTICMEQGPDGLRPSDRLLSAALAQLDPDLNVTRHALSPLIDSAEVGPALWNHLLDLIEAASGPVLITHGTDTMAFTGAALDAALAGQRKVVVLCGSMQPLGTGGDAETNLALALKAAQSAVPGLWLAFAGQILAAGGITKVNSVADRAFAVAGDLAPPRTAARRFDLTKRVGLVTITPGLRADSLAQMLAALDGAVLRVYGAGTLPATLAAPLALASRNGCRITAISQCLAGGLEPGAYAAGAALWAAGVEKGGLLSAEQALTRLWLTLSQS